MNQVAYTVNNGESPSLAAVMAISEIDSVEPLDVSPLHYSIDPDAVDALVASASTATLKFSHEDYRVKIEKNGDITVRVEPDS